MDDKKKSAPAVEPQERRKIDESKLDRIDRLGLAYCRLNGYQWDDYIGPKPEGFDQMPIDRPKPKLLRKHRCVPCKADFVSPAMHAIESIIGEANISRCWWVYWLGRTEEEWFQWYVHKAFKKYAESIR